MELGNGIHLFVGFWLVCTTPGYSGKLYVPVSLICHQCELTWAEARLKALSKEEIWQMVLDEKREAESRNWNCDIRPQ